MSITMGTVDRHSKQIVTTIVLLTTRIAFSTKSQVPLASRWDSLSWNTREPYVATPRLGLPDPFSVEATLLIHSLLDSSPENWSKLWFNKGYMILSGSPSEPFIDVKIYLVRFLFGDWTLVLGCFFSALENWWSMKFKKSKLSWGWEVVTNWLLWCNVWGKKYRRGAMQSRTRSSDRWLKYINI